MTERELEIKEQVKEAMKEVLHKCNIMGFENAVEQGIFEAIVEDHRTIQQTYWSAHIGVAEKYSKVNHDLRNEASVKACQKITEALENHLMPYV